MKFVNGTAYVGTVIDRDAQHPETLAFEHYFGEVATDCTLNGLSLIKYIKTNTTTDNINESVKRDLYNDYLSGVDVYSSTYGKVNSKSCRDKDLIRGIIHIKPSDIKHRDDLDYFSTIIFVNNLLYLVPAKSIITEDHYNDIDGFNITLGDFIKLSTIQLPLSKQINAFYKTGFFKWIDYKLSPEQRSQNIKDAFIAFNQNNDKFGGMNINNIVEIPYNFNEIKNYNNINE